MFKSKRLTNLGIIAAMLIGGFLYNTQAVSDISEISPNISAPVAESIQEEASSENFAVDVNGVLTSYDGYAKKVVIPIGVKEISYGAFMDKAEIENVVFPEGLIYIDEYAFYGCSEIKDFTLPESLQTIGRLAFGDCRQVKTLYIGKNIKKLDEFATWGCESLCFIDVSKDNAYFAANDGVLYNKKLTDLLICPTGKDGTLIIPNGVKNINEYAFFDCLNIDKIAFGKNIKNIGEAAFYGCKNLKEIELNLNLESIGSCAFAECTSLKELIVGKNVKSIGSSAFTKCSSLEKVTFLSKDIDIGHKIFFKSANVKMLGLAGSTAEAYAKKHGNVFEVI